MKGKLPYLLAGVAFLPYFFRDGVIGYDSIAFLNEICVGGYVHSPLNSYTPLASLVLGFLPCNLLLIKSLLLLLILLSIGIFLKTARLFDPERYWLAGIFLFVGPAFVQQFVKFENDVLAIPLIFLAVYWLGKAYQFPEKEPRYYAFAFLTLFIASGFWGGAGIMMIGMGIIGIHGFLMNLPIIALFGKDIFQAIGASPIIVENAPIRGIIPLFFLNYGFLTPFMAPMTYFLGIVTLLNAKYAILVVPFLALGMMKLFSHPKVAVFRNFMIGVAFALAMGMGILSLFYSPPYQSDWDAVDNAISLHEMTGKPIKNEFWLGYMLDQRGYVAENYAAYDPGWLDPIEGYIVITDQELPCPFDEIGGGLLVYQCE